MISQLLRFAAVFTLVASFLLICASGATAGGGDGKRWSAVAQGWSTHADWFEQATTEVSTTMVDYALRPRAGQTVLELAAGAGDTGFRASQILGPNGSLITSDASPGMLKLARERAAARSLTNVTFTQMDGEKIDLATGSVDGVLCRWGFMWMADPVVALRESARVLKPNAPLVLTAWGAPEFNPWSALPTAALTKAGALELGTANDPGQFSWSDPKAIEERLQLGGFNYVNVRGIEFFMNYSSFDHWLEVTREMSVTFAAKFDALDAVRQGTVVDELRKAARPHTASDGTVSFLALTWIAVAINQPRSKL